MKKQIFVLSILTAGFIAWPSFAARAQAGCCSNAGAMPGCADMSGHDSHNAQPSAVADKLPQPAATVFDNYVRIQTSLAQDSLQDVRKEALAVVWALEADTSKQFSVTVAQQAKAVANATDLRGVREAFKPFSKSLIDYASKNPTLTASYRHVHCPMANADWLQTDSTVSNPYLGKGMAHCGEFVKSNDGGNQGHQGHSMPGMDM